MKSATSSISIGPPEKKAEIAKNIGVPGGTTLIKPKPEDVAKLMDAMGNTMITFAFMQANILNNLPKFLKDATLNGLICDAKYPGLEAIIKAAVPVDRTAEVPEAKKLATPIDCDVTPASPSETYTCFCGAEKKALLYCIVLGLKNEAVDIFNKEKEAGWQDKLKCRAEALEELKTVADSIGSMYDLETPSAHDKEAIQLLLKGDAKGIDAISKAETIKFFCQAIDQKVNDAVAKLYTADNLYWLTEAAVMTALFGPANKDISTVCTIEDFKKTKYGECLCKLDTGISFCIYKVLGDYFKQEGYLSCGNTPAFDVVKKPAAVPAAILATPKGGGGSAAATSSLLLAPLTAAAAVLLRL